MAFYRGAILGALLDSFCVSRLEQQPEWKMAHENQRLDQAFLATQFLRELSLLLFKARNSGNPSFFSGEKVERTLVDTRLSLFAQLQWTSCPAPLAGEISCLEVLVDLLISFQIYTPLNKKNLKRKYGHTSHLNWEHISVVNYLPSPDEAALLPPPLLTECHATWLNTIDFLKPLVNLLPVERTTRRSLAHLGYSNMLPTWPSRPILLAGNSASQFLASIISHGARKLKYRCVIPRRPRKPLPPCFGGDLN